MAPSRIADIEEEINNLSEEEVSRRVKEIIKPRDVAEIHFTDRGIAYVDALDIIGSTNGSEIIKSYMDRQHKKDNVVKM